VGDTGTMFGRIVKEDDRGGSWDGADAVKFQNGGPNRMNMKTLPKQLMLVIWLLTAPCCVYF
jgi:hypothetical protein